MNSILLSLFLAAVTPAPAAECVPAPFCVTVCCPGAPVVKAKPKIKKKKKVVVKPAAKPAAKVEACLPAKPAPVAKKEEKQNLFFGPRLAVSLGVTRPDNQAGLVVGGELGLRLRYKRVGAELYGDLPNGIGLQALVYLILSDSLRLHVNAGLLLTGPFTLASTNDVPRTWDATVGAGVELPLGKSGLALTADLRVCIPDPIFQAVNGGPVRDANGNQVFGPGGRYLDVPTVLGHDFEETQLMVGLLF